MTLSERRAMVAPAPQAEGKPAPWHDSRFLKACRRETVNATPIWLMRQAGRYMREYRELRARVPFLDLCKNPDLVAEVTVTAAERLGVDAAILFADLLLIVEPLGFELEYEKVEGPQVQPAIRAAADVARLREVEPGALDYVFEGIRRVRAALRPDLPLIGFAAAPFTLASYLIEGGGSRSYTRTKAFMCSDPGAWRALMEHLARNLASYARGQIEAGAQALQIFDTWVGCLGPGDYQDFVLPWSRALFEALPRDVPVIHFGTGTGALLELMQEAGGSVMGLDFHVELDAAWERLGYETAVQGNLDPSVLLAAPDLIRARVERILRQAGGRPGHIFNLGHGILPETPYENVTALVEMVHELGRREDRPQDFS
jgi:uroporphyrinogen decarboxylase